MKDFYDLWVLARRFAFDGQRLSKAITATFGRRRTAVPPEPPLALTQEFHGDPAKRTQWRAFLRRGAVAEETDLGSVVDLIRAFLMPPAGAAQSGAESPGTWRPGGPWS